MATVVVPLDRFLTYTLEQLGLPNFRSRTINDANGMSIVTVYFMYKRVLNHEGSYHMVISAPLESEPKAKWDACKKALDFLKVERSLSYEDFSMREMRINYRHMDIMSNIKKIQDLMVELWNLKLSNIVHTGNRRVFQLVARIMQSADRVNDGAFVAMRSALQQMIEEAEELYDQRRMNYNLKKNEIEENILSARYEIEQVSQIL